MTSIFSFFRTRVVGAGGAAPVRNEGWEPTHRHRKGGYYRVIAEGLNEADRQPVVIYDDATGAVWVRPTTSFYDGRFTPCSSGEKLP